MKPRQEQEEDEERLRQRKLEESLEIKSLRRIVSAYLNYAEAAEEDVKRYERSFRKLPPSHKAFEPPLDMSQDIDDSGELHFEWPPNDGNVCSHESTTARGSCSKLDEACCGESSNVMSKLAEGLTANEEVQIEGCHGSDTGSCLAGEENNKMTAECCGNHVSDSNGNVPSSPRDWLDPSFQLHVPLVDVDKVRCILRNIVRDWAAEVMMRHCFPVSNSQKERDQCYKPILEELNSLFPSRCNKSPPTCLVPGAGLGRLALEISCLGFVSQGNEFSYYMMICSSFILNQTQNAGEWTIYPWIHSNCNSLSDSDQLRPVSFPDIHPASAGITEGFSMCGGDFVEVYSDPSQVGVWDAVVTCFFIDTAHNIVEYIEIISRILKDGGVWINLGPLLYHFADMYGQEDEMSIELSLEDVKCVAFNYGFEVEKEKTIETTYTTNPRSMMQNRYFAAFWTMRKKSAAVEKHST
eukprot:XP_024442837.1 carnosine N-methyltransferase isoform X3 [Populus trichocarpa]